MKNFDVTVVGGGTGGCAVAYTAAKLGLKVLVLEKGIHLGGAMTSGLVVPVMKPSDNAINDEFFNVLVTELETLGGQITYQGNRGWFNPELTKIALDNLLASVGVKVIFASEVKDVILDGKRICGVKTEEGEYFSKVVVDASGDGIVAKLSGCEFLDKKDEVQPNSLRFILSGVDAKAFGDWVLELDKDRNVTTVEEVGGKTYFSTSYTWDGGDKQALAPLFKDAVECGILTKEDTNYFQIFSVAGAESSVAFNCPRMLDCNGVASAEDLSGSIMNARQSIFRLTNFCKKYFKGFENAYISNIADVVGVRVSHRIKGKYIYTMEDIISGKKFENPVAVSNYPIDVHSREKNKSTLKKVQDYEVPLESLISANIENLYVVGRCVSADFMAQGAIRVQATCMAMGEGLARYLFQVLR